MITTTQLDELHRSMMENTAVTRSGKPVMSIVVSRAVAAKLVQSMMREPKRRARRKARTRP